MQPFEKKDTSGFSNPEISHAFVQETKDSKSLMQKELDVNQSEQILLEKRIRMMKDFINDLPSSDPQYSMLVFQTKMDQIEIDELKVREALLIQRLSQ